MSGGAVAVAVSGGVDSVALLAAARARGLDPDVLHFHHGTRPECQAEWEWVSSLAGERFRGHRLELPPGPDLQRRAREARYGVMDASPYDTILLGHHRDDQVETVLDRLSRGGGSASLGMARRRGRYLRPWLDRSRQEILDFAHAQGLTWMEDPSNGRGNRGGLRHQVIPALTALRPGAMRGIARSARLLAQDDALLQSLAAALLERGSADASALRAAPEPLARRAVLALAPGRGVEARHIDALLAGARAVALSGGWTLREDQGRVRLLPPVPRDSEGTDLCFGLWRIRSELPVQVRTAGPGERLGNTPVRERLRAAGVPAWARPYHPIVQRGTRLWLVGVYLLSPPTPDGGTNVDAMPMVGLSAPAGGALVVRL